MYEPGATTSGFIRPFAVGPRDEKPARNRPPRPVVMAPTVVANAAAPGDPMVLRVAPPSFPAATTMTMPAAVAWFTRRESTSVPSLGPGAPRLMFTTDTL